MNICVACKENETSAQVKAGCGHLVLLCNDCREDLPVIRHEDCNRCKGQVSSEEDTAMVIAYEDAYDTSDDYLLDFEVYDRGIARTCTEELDNPYYYDDEPYPWTCSKKERRCKVVKVYLPNVSSTKLVEVIEKENHPGHYVYKSPKDNMWRDCSASEDDLCNVAKEAGKAASTSLTLSILDVYLPHKGMRKVKRGSNGVFFYFTIAASGMNEWIPCTTNDSVIAQAAFNALTKNNGEPTTIGELIKEKLGIKRNGSDTADTIPAPPPIVTPVKKAKPVINPNIARVQGWMRMYARAYDTSGEAATACANELNLFEGNRVPKYVHDAAGKYLPAK